MTSDQLRLCKDHLDLMSTVSTATFNGIDMCQKQFFDRRWNCSSLAKVPKLTKDLKRGTREQAFVYAIASASLTHSIARACSIGITTKCSCGALPNEAPQGDFKWGGCGDDLDFGMEFSKAFIADKEDKKKKNMMNRHNSAAGRKIIENSLTTACKCHGVSGSCSIKTCWRALPDFAKIGDQLRDRYGMAIEVKRKRRKNVYMFKAINKKIDIIPADELVYIQKSPDYCSPDKKMGSVGTKGRGCDPDSQGPGGCDIMCCGRGYTSNDVLTIERCECKYYWCCYVKCKTCSKLLRIHRCR